MAEDSPVAPAAAINTEKTQVHMSPSMHSQSLSESAEGKDVAAPVSDGISETDIRGDEPPTNANTGDSIEKTRAMSTTSSPEIVYPTGLKLVTITIALMLTVFCVALDNTILATAIPRITDEFNSLGDVGWYASAYFLTNCTFQLLFGKIYTFYPLKVIFLISLGIFELGSLVCGAAPSSTALIVGRAVAGLGAGGLFSGSLIIISATVPLYKRPLFLSMLISMFGICSLVGPLTGGAFTDRVTWRMCFYINLPFGLVTAVGIAFFFKSPPRHQAMAKGFWNQLKQFDPIGTIVFIPSIICLLLALQWGGTKYAWSDAHIIALFVVFGVLFIAFTAIQIVSGENATVPVRIVTSSRTIPALLWWVISIGGSFFIFVYYIPIWFQAIHGVSATQSGIDTVPFLLAQVFGSISSGIFVTKVGYYTPMLFLCVIFSTIGAGLLTTWTPNTPVAHWIGYEIIYGMGIGFGFQQGTTIVQTILPMKDIPIGTSLVVFVQILGGSLFVSAGENIFTNELTKNLAGVLPPQLLGKVAAAGATGFYDIVPSNLLPEAVDAYNGAITKTFQMGLILSCLMFLGAIFIEVKNVKEVKTKRGNAVGEAEEDLGTAAGAKQETGSV